jgi:hypothetical protein
MTASESDVRELTVMAQKAVLELFELAIVAAAITGNGAERLSVEDRDVLAGAKLMAEAVQELVGAIRLVVLGEAKGSKADSDLLWDIADRDLKRSYDLTVRDIARIDDVWYSQVAGPVNPDARVVAAKTARWVADDLRLDRTPPIRWFTERVHDGQPKTFRSSVGTTGGLKDGLVWVHANRSPREAIASVAHELRHVWQSKGGAGDSESGLDYSDRPSERDAHSYARLVRDRLWGPYGHGEAGIWLRNARVAAHPAHGNF